MNTVPVLYDEQQQNHCPRFEYEHGQQNPYLEVPQRARNIALALQRLDWVRLLPPLPESGMAEEELFAIHDPALIAHLQGSSRQAGLQELGRPDLAPVYRYPWIFPLRKDMFPGLLRSAQPDGCFAFDTYSPIGKDTWPAVLSSARLAWQGAGLLLLGEKLCYTICRPPGHHAGIDSVGGYCYLNNAALAASRLLQLGPGAILDIDYHHGNGTQEIFWDFSQVFFASIHADPLEEYPYFSGFASERGGEQAPGSTLNLPLAQGCDDGAYLQALDSAIQAIKAFRPNWLVLSAGFDTCAADPCGAFNLSPVVYQEIGRRIAILHVPILVVQEGGYALEMIGDLAARLLSGLQSELKSG
jgi:acetoin utilization deacetylase AcuC-like enzyme